MARITGVEWRTPGFICLAVLICGFLVAFILMERNHELNLKRTPDSADSEAISEAPPSLTVALSALRTPLYPAVLRVTRAMGGDYALLPVIQFSLYALAATALFFAAQLSGFKPWEALLISGPLATARVLWEYSSQMMTEAVAVSACIAAVAVSLIVAARGPGIKRNCLLATAIVAAVLTRPAFLFLVGACPLAIAVVSPMLRATTARLIFTEFVRNFLFVIAPILAYSFLRLVAVGEFGVVSSSGVTLAGIGTNPAMLKAATVPSLSSPEMRGLARAILAKRNTVARLRDNSLPPYVYDENRIEHERTLESWVASFDPSVLTVAIPAARSYYGASNVDNVNPDWIPINKKLGMLSRETIRLHKGKYLKYVALSFRHSFQTVFQYENAANFAIALAFIAIALGFVRQAFATGLRIENQIVALIALGAVLLVSGKPGIMLSLPWTGHVTRWRFLGMLGALFTLFTSVAMTVSTFWQQLAKNQMREGSDLRRAMGFVTLAGILFGSGMLLVSFVEVPQRRYILALSPLLPGPILLVSLKWVGRTWRSSGVRI